jgi:DNA-nicking Smr family endonuclease
MKFRKMADEAYSKRAQLSRKSQEAYQSGNKKEAAELSAQAKRQLELAEGYNIKAAEYVFIQNNKDSDDNDIDLHGLYVKEAEYILKQRIISGIRMNQETLDCIVGKGLHSKNGIAKLKPAVEKLCNEANLKFWIDSKNTGVLHIDIKNKQIPQSWYNINPDGIGAMDENYCAYHSEEKPSNNYNNQNGQTYQQYQSNPNQPHYQQQQYQNQNQNQNSDLVGAFCSLLATFLKAFCR